MAISSIFFSFFFFFLFNLDYTLECLCDLSNELATIYNFRNIEFIAQKSLRWMCISSGVFCFSLNRKTLFLLLYWLQKFAIFIQSFFMSLGCWAKNESYCVFFSFFRSFFPVFLFSFTSLSIELSTLVHSHLFHWILLL